MRITRDRLRRCLLRLTRPSHEGTQISRRGALKRPPRRSRRTSLILFPGHLKDLDALDFLSISCENIGRVGEIGPPNPVPSKSIGETRAASIQYCLPCHVAPPFFLNKFLIEDVFYWVLSMMRILGFVSCFELSPKLLQPLDPVRLPALARGTYFARSFLPAGIGLMRRRAPDVPRIFNAKSYAMTQQRCLSSLTVGSREPFVLLFPNRARGKR